MEYREFPAPPPLDRWIRCIWWLRGAGAAVEPVIPDGRIEIILHRGDPFSEMAADGSRTTQAAALASGQLSQPLHLVPGTVVDVIGIRFRTAAANVVLAAPLAGLRDLVVSLGEIDRALRTSLERAVRANDPVQALWIALAKHVEPRRLDERFVQATRELEAGMAVAHVARRQRMSVRTLERRLAASVGLAPKLLQRVMRFRRYHRLLQAGEAGSRAAVRSGYFDQSHADRDFRDFTGTSPTRHFGDPDHLGRTLLSHSS